MDAKVFSDISSLTCCVCYEKISETKTLYCGHSICGEPCLDKVLSHDHPACPVCFVAIKLPPSGLTSDLPTNYGLGSVLRTYRNTTSRSENTCDSPEENSSSPDQGKKKDNTYETPFDFARQESNNNDEDSTKSAVSDQQSVGPVCKRHLKSLRFSCHSCSEDVCFMCLQTIHKAHEFDVRDMGDDDGIYMKDSIKKCLRQRKQQKAISMKLLQSREEYLELSKTTERDIKQTAERLQKMVADEANTLIQELRGLASSRSEYFMDLYLALENTMVRQNKLVRMITEVGTFLEDSGNPIELKSIESIERLSSDIDKDTEALEQLCQCRHPHLQFNRKRTVGKLIGNLVKVCHRDGGSNVYHYSQSEEKEPLSIMRLEKEDSMRVHRSCVGVVWLSKGRCVVIDDRISTVGDVIFTILNVDDKGRERQTETLKRCGHSRIHVCGTVSYDLSSILLVHACDIIKVTFSEEPGVSPIFKLTESPQNVEGVHWGQYTDEYFVLTSHPWRVYRVDGTGYKHLVIALGSRWYGPLIATTESRFILADISDNVFVVKDTTKVFPERRLESPGNLKKAWPAGINFCRETGEWFCLWKSVSDKTVDNVDWMLTRYSASFEFRGIVLNGSMAERDPRFIATCKDKLSVLFHGGELLVFNILSYQLKEYGPS